jgi:probable O-glycosylation ligase (exosortase A-associated)
MSKPRAVYRDEPPSQIESSGIRSRSAPREGLSLPHSSLGRVRGPHPTPFYRTLDILRSLDLRTVVVVGLLLTYIWRFHDLTPELRPLRVAALFTVSSWVFFLLAPQWHVLKRGLSLPYIWLFLVWSLWIAIGIPFALSPFRAWDIFVSAHLKNVTMALFLLGFFATLQHVRLVVAIQVFGAAVLTFYYAKGGFPTWGSPVPMYDRNDFALLLVMTAPLVLFVSLATREKWMKLAAWTLLLGIGASVIWGQSRGGFLALSATALFLLLRLKGIKVWVRALLPILVVLGVYLAPAESKERLQTLLSLEEDYNVQSDVGRVEIWKRGFGYLMDHPIFGVGYKNFTVAEGTLAPRGREGDPDWKRSVAHNSFVEVTVETGFIGGLLYVVMLGAAFVRLLRIRRRFAGGDDAHSVVIRQLADCLSASIVGFTVAGVFLSLGDSSLFFSLLCIVAGFELVTSRIAGSHPSNHTRRSQPARRVLPGVAGPMSARVS